MKLAISIMNGNPPSIEINQITALVDYIPDIGQYYIIARINSENIEQERLMRKLCNWLSQRIDVPVQCYFIFRDWQAQKYVEKIREANPDAEILFNIAQHDISYAEYKPIIKTFYGKEGYRFVRVVCNDYSYRYINTFCQLVDQPDRLVEKYMHPQRRGCMVKVDDVNLAARCA